MILRVAGIHHFDPTCRQQLLEWLRSYSESHGDPAFLATEWDEQHFLQVKGQRDRFFNLLRDAIPGLSDEVLNTLKLSLGFEGDTHLEVFPDVEVLWLDQGRRGDVALYAEDRLAMYREFLAQEEAPVDNANVLVRLSQSARQTAEAPEAGGGRDGGFANLIIERAAKRDGDYGVIIVGGFHAGQQPGSMRSLLDEAKLTCEVTDL